MIKIKPYLRTYKNNKEEGIIWISFYVDRNRIHFTTKIKCQML